MAQPSSARGTRLPGTCKVPRAHSPKVWCFLQPTQEPWDSEDRDCDEFAGGQGAPQGNINSAYIEVYIFKTFKATAGGADYEIPCGCWRANKSEKIVDFVGVNAIF